MSTFTIKEFEKELNSAFYPGKTYQEFQQIVEKATHQFITELSALNVQFVALQDLTVLGVINQFFPIAGCAAVRRIYMYDIAQKAHFVRLEANALVPVKEAVAPQPVQDNQIASETAPPGTSGPLAPKAPGSITVLDEAEMLKQLEGAV